MRKLLLLLLFFSFLYSKEFSIATYNVENLFDMQKDGYEYPEFVPNSEHGWNKDMFEKKLSNIARVIIDLDVDILGLEEIENANAASLLNESLGVKKYPYMYTTDFRKSTQLTLFSRYPIMDTKILHVKDFPRDILKVKLLIDKYELFVYLNHWPSVAHPIKKRLEFADTLSKDLDTSKEFIILGDFNSPFEIQKNGWGESILKLSNVGKNLWLELPFKQRFSHSFFRSKKALDHIILSKTLFDKKGIEYKPNSFEVFQKEYLMNEKSEPLRWEISKKGKGEHLGRGFSDHFALKATFQTDNYTHLHLEKKSIKELLKVEDGKVDILLENVKLKSVEKYGVFIEDSSKKSIFIYKPDEKLEFGSIYTLHVKQISTFKGEKEISLFKLIKK